MVSLSSTRALVVMMGPGIMEAISVCLTLTTSCFVQAVILHLFAKKAALNSAHVPMCVHEQLDGILDWAFQ